MQRADPRVLADTNILFPTRLRDIFVQLAINSEIELLIPAGGLRELESVLFREGVLGHLAPKMISEKLSMFEVSDGSEALGIAHTTDPKDRFIAATAIRWAATHLVTYNTKDFDLSKTSISCVSPDSFLALLLSERPDQVISAVWQVRDRYKNPKIETGQFLQILENLRLTNFARDLSERC